MKELSYGLPDHLKITAFEYQVANLGFNQGRQKLGF